MGPPPAPTVGTPQQGGHGLKTAELSWGHLRGCLLGLLCKEALLVISLFYEAKQEAFPV